jgi:ABC-2 type transport system permease protein
VKLFFRDTTQWSQLILLAVLVVIYLFNIRALPLFTGEQVPFFFITLVSFLNLGLAGFVLASIAARFIFPSVSLEGRQMWLLRSSPLDLRALIWSKYWTGTVPLLVLALVITVLTNVLLQATGFMMAVSVGTILLLTLAIAALALGYGAVYPQFDTENAAQIPTSFGGLVFMMTTVVLLAVVIVLEAAPVYAYLQAMRNDRAIPLSPGMLLPFIVVILVCALATAIPLRVGLRRMEEYEF